MSETYTVRVFCNNCGYSRLKEKPRGCPLSIFSISCDQCGCVELRESKYYPEPKIKKDIIW